LVHGRITSFWQLEAARTCCSSGTVASLSWASDGTVGTRSATSPRNSGVETSLRAWPMSGIEASMAGPDERTAGRSAAASERRAGNDALRASRAGLAACSVCGSSVTVCSSDDCWPANAAAVRLKLVIRACSSGGLASSASGARVADEAGEVPLLQPERGLVDLRRVLVRRLPVGDRRVVARGPGRLHGLRVLVEEDLEVVAGVGLQRGQDLVQLHRRAGVLDLDRVAVAELGRARRARVDVDEEVALEEDPRTDRRGRVDVDRQALVLDFHRDHGALVDALAHRLDVGDLADVDAGDPHEGVRLDVVGRLERGLDREARP